MKYYDLIESPIGQLLVTSDGQNLTGLFLENHTNGPSVGSDWQRDPSQFDQTREQLNAYFRGSLTEFVIPVRMDGTDFQKAVWDQLVTIPFGQTVTYGDLAVRIGQPSASRAVGAAVGRNPISIIVPCHRVVGSGGAITGYAGGLDRKRTLLQLEASTSGAGKEAAEKPRLVRRLHGEVGTPA